MKTHYTGAQHPLSAAMLPLGDVNAEEDEDAEGEQPASPQAEDGGQPPSPNVTPDGNPLGDTTEEPGETAEATHVSPDPPVHTSVSDVQAPSPSHPTIALDEQVPEVEETTQFPQENIFT